MFRQSTERFTEMLQGMKQMAAEMQRELDTTRTELRRGILELPQETAESAAQMRRVIVDQIEALAELNRIVARHGRGIEARRAAPRRAVLDRDRRRPCRSPRRVGRTPTRRGSPGAAARTAARRADCAADTVDLRQRRPRRVPAARRNAAPPLAPPAPAKQGTGWLTDLLHRASRDDGSDNGPRCEDRPARGEDAPRRATRIESLDSLSVDIARMIDHDAAAELWDRYKRGERNVFTRRLYTMQGQKAFDEIRKRYRADREFKQTVDRYIARVRAAARGSLARRPRPGGGAHLPHLGNRQGLHHARPRGRPLRLNNRRQTKNDKQKARFGAPFLILPAPVPHLLKQSRAHNFAPARVAPAGKCLSYCAAMGASLHASRKRDCR